MVLTTSQDLISAIRNTHYSKFRKAVASNGQGIYAYNSAAIKKKIAEFECNAPEFSSDYIVNPFKFQYDLEVYIFLHYEELTELEAQIGDSDKFIIDEYGVTGLDKYRHLLNAFQIRWPTKILPSGQYKGDFLVTPWSEDFAKSMAQYHDAVFWGGAGQGKTYDFLALMCVIFDNFICTRSGAQCTFSTVSEDKIKSSTWPYVCKLYPVDPERRKFSLYAGRAIKGADYTFKRVDNEGKEIVGASFKGVLLQKGLNDSRVVDKLTGSHDPVARCYLLDEAQATDAAPIDAYNNMYLHPDPRYSFFGMSGNYEKENDLLGINVEPNIGWENVNEATHIYEGTLRSFKGSLGRTTCVIHYNNDLSPAILNPELAKRFLHLPNEEKKKKLYPTKESKESYGYKRFWIGFRFEKESADYRLCFTYSAIEDYRASESPDFGSNTVFILGSFDPAPASKDRNIFTTFKVGMSRHGLVTVAPDKVHYLPKIGSELKYHKETLAAMLLIIAATKMLKNGLITDFTYRHDFIDMLNNAGIIAHPIIYNGALPRKRQINELTKEWEDIITLETLKTFAGSFEKTVTYYAHEKILDRITLGAYAMRMFMEKGCLKGFNATILDTVPSHKGFEKEFLKRKFMYNKNRSKNLLCIDMKEKFKNDHGFSPDIQDTFFQFFYMLFYIFKVDPHKNTLGLIGKDKSGPNMIDKLKKAFKPVKI